jgi:hypothetical protein
MTLEEIQHRFLIASKKEHWSKLRPLLFSEDKESVVQGISLIEQLDKKVYYDGICSFLEDDGKGNWLLKKSIPCQNELALKSEIIRMAEENIGHAIKEAFQKNLFDRMLFRTFEHLPFERVEEKFRMLLLSKISKMVEIEREGTCWEVMKYQVTQVFWESVMGENPSRFTGVSRPVESVSWLDCVVFANKLSEKERLERVYEINGTDVHRNIETNGYRLLTEPEWEYVAKGTENYQFAGSNEMGDVGWSIYDSGNTTHAVRQKRANEYGLYDMSGNVWEWCWDEYQKTSQRVCKGGSWRRSPNYCANSYSSGFFHKQRYDYVGVRLCRGTSHL